MHQISSYSYMEYRFPRGEKRFIFQGVCSLEKDGRDDGEIRKVRPAGDGMVGQQHIAVLQLIARHRQLQTGAMKLRATVHEIEL